MTKVDLIKEIKTIANENQANVTDKQVELVYDAVLKCLKDKTISEGKLSLKDFGVFSIRVKAARKARNPRTGETIDVPEGKAVSFKPATAFKESLSK